MAADLDGHSIAWRSWQLRFSFNVREGLVLHQVGFTHDNVRRSILYRASVAEVVTAYGDPSKFWSWMELFDEGVFGLGYLSMPVRPGREVPANAVAVGRVESPPLSEILSGLLRYSNNAEAELIGLAASRKLTGISRNMSSVVRTTIGMTMMASAIAPAIPENPPIGLTTIW